MKTDRYGHFISEQIQNKQGEDYIFNTAIADILTAEFNIETDRAKKLTNVTLKRLADKGELVRISKGIYVKAVNTPFGRLAASADEVLTKTLLEDKGIAIGYIAGPTLLNAIGLCSLVSSKRYIATNHYRRRLPDRTTIRLQRPMLPVTCDNVGYLQTLDAISSIDIYMVDAQQPELILRNLLRSKNIDNERLIWYARNCCSNKVLLKTIDIALGGMQ